MKIEPSWNEKTSLEIVYYGNPDTRQSVMYIGSLLLGNLRHREVQPYQEVRCMIEILESMDILVQFSEALLVDRKYNVTVKYQSCVHQL